LGVDHGRGVGDVEFVGELLEVVETDGELVGAGFEFLGAVGVEKEAEAFDADGVFAGGG
jgi:hypothetical protein